MAVTIKKVKTGEDLARQIEEIAGVDLSVCFQCKKCTSGCGVADLVKTRPSEVIRRLHLGAGNELLEEDIVWTCMSCETCSQRCPMGIDVAAVMDALRAISIEQGIAGGEGNVHLFNRAFLGTVKFFGRTYDLAMVALYKMGTGKLMNDTEKFPTMLMKRKIAIFPSFKGDRKTVSRIFKKTKNKEDK